MTKLRLLALVAFAPIATAQTPTPTAAPTPPPSREKTIYLPYEKLEEIFEKEGRGVFLPYKEFIDMWNRLQLPELAKKSPPPVDGVLSSAKYAGRIEGDVVSLDAKLEMEALKDGWSVLKLGAPGLSIADAKTTAHLSVLDNEYQVIFPAKGK